MKSIAESFADLFFPQQNECHLCEAFNEEGGVLCKRCLSALLKLRLPFDNESAFPVDRLECLSAFEYRDEARSMIHQMKYAADRLMAVMFGEHISLTLCRRPDLLSSVQLVVPVPLHEHRQFKRGYNQAAWLAEELCFHTGLSMREDVLIRTADTASQTRRSRGDRFAAMQNVFCVPNCTAVHHRHILLVDDVLTTGATAAGPVRSGTQAPRG